MSTPPRGQSGDWHPGDLVEAVAAGHVCARCHRPLRTTNDPSPATPSSAGCDAKSPSRVWVAVRTWPEGRICSGCFARACETYGACPACGIHRLLPARLINAAGDHQPCCADCSPGVGNFTCTRCGQEGWHHYKRVCGRCVLGDRLATHLDDGTGRVCPELVPLYDRIVAMPRPRTGILWLSKPHVPPILRALARGQVPLTHDGLSMLTPLKSVVHVRDLLMASGVLPAPRPAPAVVRAMARHLAQRFTGRSGQRPGSRYDCGSGCPRARMFAEADPASVCDLACSTRAA